jgi:hypothetical protein
MTQEDRAIPAVRVSKYAPLASRLSPHGTLALSPPNPEKSND